MSAEQSACASSGKPQHWDQIDWDWRRRQVRRLQTRFVKAIIGRSCSRRALPRLEPYAPKGSRTVPRGEGGRKAILLPDELLHKHLINYTPGYVQEELEQQPLVTNPEVTKLKQQRAGLVSELNRLKVELADQLLKKTSKRPKRRTPARSRAEVLAGITTTESAILLSDQALDKLSAEIRFDEARDGEKLVRLNHEKKRFLDSIKVFACNLRAELGRILLKHYDLEKEIWPAVSMILERGGLVKLEEGRLQVTLRRFKDREIDYAARRLCADLNGMSPVTLDRFQFPIQVQ